MEATLRRGEDLWDIWNRKLCIRMQKPMGKPGVASDCIFQCMAIERCIQDEANVAILGADSAESGHSCNNGDSALLDVVANDAFDDVGDDGDEDDDEVVTVNAVDENAAAVAMASPCPQSLLAFIGGGVGASSVDSTLASRGGDDSQNKYASTTKEESNIIVQHQQRGGGGEKTKNSTNREWGSILKAMDRVAESIKSRGGGGSGSNMMILMLSMQMQQQMQQFSMHQQMFQQQIQIQIAAMEKRAETSEKYLHRIATTIGHTNVRGAVMMTKTTVLITMSRYLKNKFNT
jgi:hypothetical protein